MIKVSASTKTHHAGVFSVTHPAHVQHTESLPEHKGMDDSLLARLGDSAPVLPVEKCLLTVNSVAGAVAVMDEELVMLGSNGKIPSYMLENTLGDPTRAVKIRRALISRETHTKTLETSLYQWNIMITPRSWMLYLPMATTEGCLVASTSRGCKAITLGGGASTILLADGMTRCPCIEFASISEAADCKLWIEGDGLEIMQEAFNSTTSFGRLHKLKVLVAGRLVSAPILILLAHSIVLKYGGDVREFNSNISTKFQI
ncbi:3-hydroxy-3-methylglutaryl-coenzyme A (HMG-CoA) reductase isozyme [Mortierella alpina]|nr:3-hydroxy-3-methylglutaryl-coenzyme A (HMG-CoA) reductase isozyme [Mortierella alpina]